MTTVYEHQEFLASQLRLLEERKRLGFALWCTERLFPNYVAFRKETGQGDPLVLRRALDIVWEHLKNQPPSSLTGVASLSRNCESQAPASEDSGSLLVTAAQDAVFAVCSLLDYLEGNDVDALLRPSSYALDSLDLYIQETEALDLRDMERESKILEHPLMRVELEEQRRLLGQLSMCEDVYDLVEGIREVRVGNLGVG